MLSESNRELLTAYVDGELSPRQRQAARRLLERSAEARTLLRQLQGDADRLRSLSRPRLDEPFAERLLEALATRDGRSPSRPAAPPRPAPVPAWFGGAVAASVLLVVSLAAYVYLATAPRPSSPVAAVTHPAPVSSPTPSVRKPRAVDVAPERPAVPPAQAVAPPSEAPARSPLPPVPPPRPLVPPGRVEEIPDGDELTAPARDKEPFEVYRPRLSPILALRDLGQEDGQRKLREELQQDSAFRLDWFCHDAAKAVEQLKGLLAGRRARLVIDQAAQARLSRGLGPAYALYAEDLAAEDWAALLHALGRAEKPPEGRRRPDRLVLSRLTANDRRELTALLGFDPEQPPPVRPRPTPGVDVRKPLSDQTAAEVVRTLAGPPAAAPERQVLLLSYPPSRAQASASREIKLFQAGRKEPRPGAVQLLGVLRDGKR